MLASSDEFHKEGDGVLFLSGDHSGSGKIEGRLYADAGTVAFDHNGSLGAGITMATATALQARADNIDLDGKITIAEGASIAIDVNDHPTQLGAIAQDGATAVTIEFINNGSQMTDILLNKDYAKAHNNDKMVINSKVNASIDGHGSIQWTLSSLRASNSGTLYYVNADVGIAAGLALTGSTAYTATDNNSAVLYKDANNNYYITSDTAHSTAVIEAERPYKLSDFQTSEIFYDGTSLENGFYLASTTIYYNTLADLDGENLNQTVYNSTGDQDEKLFLSDLGGMVAVQIDQYDDEGQVVGSRDATLDDFSYYSAYIPAGGSIQDGFYRNNNRSEAFTANPSSLGDTARVIYGAAGQKLILNDSVLPLLKAPEQYAVASLGTVYMSDAGLAAGFYKVSTSDFTTSQSVSGSSALVYSAANNIDGKLFNFSMPAHTDAAMFEKVRLADKVDMINGSKLSLTDNAILPKLEVKGNSPS